MISFIILSIVQAFNFLSIDEWIVILICVVVSVILAILCAKIYEHGLFNRVIKTINHKSINRYLWMDVIDYKLGTDVKVFLKGRDVLYIGALIEHEENGTNSWIILKDYLSCNPITQEIYYNSNNDEKITTVMINLQDVDRIEMFYNENTKIFDI